jgi:hypothetical protein
VRGFDGDQVFGVAFGDDEAAGKIGRASCRERVWLKV